MLQEPGGLAAPLIPVPGGLAALLILVQEPGGLAAPLDTGAVRPRCSADPGARRPCCSADPGAGTPLSSADPGALRPRGTTDPGPGGLAALWLPTAWSLHMQINRHLLASIIETLYLLELLLQELRAGRRQAGNLGFLHRQGNQASCSLQLPGCRPPSWLAVNLHITLISQWEACRRYG
ncbi:hypothetical protein MDA_GLEAN10015781 [Myotis davidii]|uniref:Uncharacterized protein n=1 Tax=Myotis davidii TaxID=225400 RepID=L5LL66_MYODS|nr:hypothetical protein MDA_GLEAN10015781 [Myotis davidii]